jgi:hypothetical protein
MMYLVIMSGHVPVRRVVTAKGYPTGLAGTQMQPPAVNFNAFLTNILLCGFDFGDGAQVFA